MYLYFINSLVFDLTGGYEDRSELAEAVKEVVRCLSSRAVKPSPLRLTLRMLELERVHAILSSQCLTSIADRKMFIVNIPCCIHVHINEAVYAH